MFEMHCTCDHCQWVTCPIMQSLAWGCQLYFAWPLGSTAVHETWGTTGLLTHTSSTHQPAGSAWIQFYFLNKRFVQSDTSSHCQPEPSHEAQWTNLIGPSLWKRQCTYACVFREVILLYELPHTIFNLQTLPDSYNSASSMETFGLTERKTRAELNVCHSTFGICFQEDLDIGCRDISFLLLIPSDSCPAISFVFFYDVQQLALCYGDSAFVMTCERRGREKTRKGKILQV